VRVGVTGHQSIPASAYAAVLGEVENELRRYAANFRGVSSLAAGADQIFSEAVLRLGGKLHVVLPCRHYDAAFESSATLANFRVLLQRADAAETLDFDQPSEEAFLAAGRRVVVLSDVLVAVWDGQPAKGLGGTADIVEFARSRNIEISIVWPSDAER
jgi:hypothetical protein